MNNAWKRLQSPPSRLFGLLVCFPGLWLTYSVLLKPLGLVSVSQHWIETPCTILESQLGVDSNSESIMYSVDVKYEYEVDGESYLSDRYSFFRDSSVGVDSKKEVVSTLQPGTQSVCFVNPKDPTKAVLYRGITVEILFGLLPLSVLAFGLFIMAPPSESRVNRFSQGESLLHSTPLRTAFPGWVPVFWCSILLLIWAGFMTLVFADHPSRFPEWGVLISGLVVGGVFVFNFYNYLYPPIRLFLNEGRIDEGEEVTLTWQIRKTWSTLDRIAIRIRSLEGNLSNTPRSDSQHLVKEQDILVSEEPSDLRYGRTLFPWPRRCRGTGGESAWAIRVIVSTKKKAAFNEQFKIAASDSANLQGDKGEDSLGGIG